MKQFIQKIFNLFGYKVMKIKSPLTENLDNLTKILITKSEPIIFDVGQIKDSQS